MNILYSGCYYLMRETKKPVYLDFYDLENKDLNILCIYDKQTVRYNSKWFFVEMKKSLFYSEKERDSAPRTMIKFLYQKPKVLNMEGK